MSIISISIHKYLNLIRVLFSEPLWYNCSGDFMKVIICLDDNNGMLFNNRRQSRDSAVLEDVFASLGEEKLNIFQFSQRLFDSFADKVSVCTTLAEQGTYFVENIDLDSYECSIEEIVVYRWNRVYPADFYCEIDLGAFNIVSEVELQGSSHEKITKIVYSR